MEYIYIVITSQGSILGAFTNRATAEAEAEKCQYFCRISQEPIIKK